MFQKQVQTSCAHTCKGLDRFDSLYPAYSWQQPFFFDCVVDNALKRSLVCPALWGGLASTPEEWEHLAGTLDGER